MTNEQKLLVLSLRAEGLGYRRVANRLGISENTVKSFCRRHKNMPQVEEPEKSACKCCGAPIQQTPGRKEKKFCSDECRRKWWNSHLDLANRRAIYEITCAHCGKHFSVYGDAKRKYCSHECYVADRFGDPDSVVSDASSEMTAGIRA